MKRPGSWACVTWTRPSSAACSRPATGRSGIVVGGSDEDVAAARPLLELWGAPERIRHLGPVGSGNAMKAVINMCLGIAMAGVGEAMRLGAELSLPQDAVLDALEAGPFGFSVKQKREMLAKRRLHPAVFLAGSDGKGPAAWRWRAPEAPLPN